MDGQRFDRITRAFASGTSRRSMLKGLLGIGGTAAVSSVAAHDTDARRRGGVTSPTTPAPTTTTTPEPPICNGTQCGLECCEFEEQCCDGECCPAGYDCLPWHFPEGPSVEEETCCRADLVCNTGTTKCCADDEECCVREDNSYCIPPGGCCFDEECPSNPLTCEVGVCDPSTGVCSLVSRCSDVEECCPRDGVGHCIPMNSECCQDSECEGFPPCVPGVCEIGTWQCGFQNAPDGTECDDGEPCTLNDRCLDGSCLGNPMQCPEGEVCFDGTCQCIPQCDGLTCGTDGCGGICGCGAGTKCCERVCIPNNQCCTDADCPGDGCNWCVPTTSGGRECHEGFNDADEGRCGFCNIPNDCASAGVCATVDKDGNLCPGKGACYHLCI